MPRTGWGSIRRRGNCLSGCTRPTASETIVSTDLIVHEEKDGEGLPGFTLELGYSSGSGVKSHGRSSSSYRKPQNRLWGESSEHPVPAGKAGGGGRRGAGWSDRVSGECSRAFELFNLGRGEGCTGGNHVYRSLFSHHTLL